MCVPLCLDKDLGSCNLSHVNHVDSLHCTVISILLLRSSVWCVFCLIIYMHSISPGGWAFHGLDSLCGLWMCPRSYTHSRLPRVPPCMWLTMSVIWKLPYTHRVSLHGALFHVFDKYAVCWNFSYMCYPQCFYPVCSWFWETPCWKLSHIDYILRLCLLCAWFHTCNFGYETFSTLLTRVGFLLSHVCTCVSQLLCPTKAFTDRGPVRCEPSHAFDKHHVCWEHSNIGHARNVSAIWVLSCSWRTYCLLKAFPHWL